MQQKRGQVERSHTSDLDIGAFFAVSCVDEITLAVFHVEAPDERVEGLRRGQHFGFPVGLLETGQVGIDTNSVLQVGTGLGVGVPDVALNGLEQKSCGSAAAVVAFLNEGVVELAVWLAYVGRWRVGRRTFIQSPSTRIDTKLSFACVISVFI